LRRFFIFIRNLLLNENWFIKPYWFEGKREYVLNVFKDIFIFIFEVQLKAPITTVFKDFQK